MKKWTFTCSLKGHIDPHHPLTGTLNNYFPICTCTMICHLLCWLNWRVVYFFKQTDELNAYESTRFLGRCISSCSLLTKHFSIFFSYIPQIHESFSIKKLYNLLYVFNTWFFVNFSTFLKFLKLLYIYEEFWKCMI